MAPREFMRSGGERGILGHAAGWASAAAVLIMALFASALSGSPMAGPAMAVSGFPGKEQCVGCHREVPRFSSFHDPATLGCVSCHLGDGAKQDAKEAHRGLEPFPGRMATVAQTCGQANCHAPLVPLMKRSIMHTVNGMVTLTRAALSGTSGAAAHSEAPGREALPLEERLGEEGVDSYLRKLCVSCHLGNERTAHGASTRQRGGGCAACHLRAYPGEDAAIRKAAQPGKSPRGGPGELRHGVHPTLTVAVDDRACFGCHSRSSRIALNYFGLAETETGDSSRLDSSQREALGRLEDGRLVRHMPPDVHAEAGMTCIDCHTATGVMGAGRHVSLQREQGDVQCGDCHGATPMEKKVSALTARELRYPGLYGWVTPDLARGSVMATARRGTPLLHLRREEGRVVLRGKVNGKSILVPPAKGGPHHNLKGHERLTCDACHAGWAPQCDGCHIAYDPAGRQWDHLKRRQTPGRWVESRWSVRADPPALGVGAGNRITPFVPGMSLIAEFPGRPSQRRVTYARISPHTTTRRGRSCRDCHATPSAMGVITGQVAHPERPAWSLPLGWVAKGAKAPVPALHPGDRSFSAAERDRIARVGGCLDCHWGGERWFGDFPAALANLGDARAHARKHAGRKASAAPSPVPGSPFPRTPTP